jgi:hypothetical protein
MSYQVGNRYFTTSPIQIITQANIVPGSLYGVDVSPWVPSGALWYYVSSPLGRAYACTSSNYNAPGTIDMAWTVRLTVDTTDDFDKFLQIAMQNQIPGTFQEASGKTVCIPNINNALYFYWTTRCPNQHDYYDSAQLTLWLLGWEMPNQV